MSKVRDKTSDAFVSPRAVNAAAPIIDPVSATGSNELAVKNGDDAELAHLTTILTTLVDARLLEDPDRMDGTTHTGSPAPSPERGVPGS